MYLGMAFAYAGCAFLVNSTWCLAFLPIAIVLVQVLAIRREEKYLAEKFGDVYESYRSRVRRWI
jgi:protein-S-isoprenylcysteine O-methyltransferase Ste14